MPTMLVLGATSGIARATARAFAGSGWTLQLAGRDIQRLQEVAVDLSVRRARSGFAFRLVGAFAVLPGCGVVRCGVARGSGLRVPGPQGGTPGNRM